MQEFLDRRKMTEFGSLALVDEGAGDGDGVQLSLPGVRKGEIHAPGLNYQPPSGHGVAQLKKLTVYE